MYLLEVEQETLLLAGPQDENTKNGKIVWFPRYAAKRTPWE